MTTNIPSPIEFDEKATRVQSLMKQYGLQELEQGVGQMPNHVMMTEKPVHIMVAYMQAAGRTRAEISEQTGMSIPALSQLSRQPWFRKRLQEICDSAGKDMVKAFLEGEVLPSLEVLRTIRDDTKERGATRVSASNSILDRFLGKPTVHVESTNNLNIHNADKAADQVQAELTRIDEELKTRGFKQASRAN